MAEAKYAKMINSFFILDDAHKLLLGNLKKLYRFPDIEIFNQLNAIDDLLRQPQWYLCHNLLFSRAVPRQPLKTRSIAFVFSVAMATTAVVDVKSIIEGTDIMKGAAADMEKKFAPQRDELMAMQKTLEEDTKRLSKNKAVMKTAEVEALSKKIADTQKTLMEKEQTFRSEVYKAQNETIQKAMDKVKSATAEVAKKKNISTVLAAGEVLYIDAKNDITADVKKIDQILVYLKKYNLDKVA